MKYVSTHINTIMCPSVQHQWARRLWLVLCTPLIRHSVTWALKPRTWGKTNMTSESKTLDKTRPHSARVKNKHEECQCLWGRKRRLKIYIYSESVRDQTAKLIHSSFKPCAAALPQFPHLTTYRLSTSAIAMKTPGWPAVTSPRARVPATRRKGLVWLPWAKTWAQFTHDPFLLAHKKQTCQLGLFVFIESNHNNEQTHLFFIFNQT